MFSHRTSIDRTLNALAVAKRRLDQAAQPLLDLTQSNPTRVELPYDETALGQALQMPEGWRYRPEPQGGLAARDTLAADLLRQGIEANAERMLLTASTSEAYAHLFKLLCDPGDEVLIASPSYPLLEHLACLEGVRTRPYSLAYDGRWHVDLASLRDAMSERTRAIVVVHPNNPTGHYVAPHEIEALRELRLPIISDEVFSCYPLTKNPDRLASLQGMEGLLVFSLFGLSKRAGLPGLKLAWLCASGPKGMLSEAWARLELIADTFLSVNTPVERAIADILAASRVTHDAIRQRLRDNLSHLQAATKHGPTTLLHAEGGWYATLRLPAVLDEDTWILQLLEHAGVYVQPGYFFDFPREPYVVLSLLTPPRMFQEGVSRVLQHVEDVVA